MVITLSVHQFCLPVNPNCVSHYFVAISGISIFLSNSQNFMAQVITDLGSVVKVALWHDVFIVHLTDLF